MSNLMELNARILASNKAAEAQCEVSQSYYREALELCDEGFVPVSPAELLTPAILEQLPAQQPPAPAEQSEPIPVPASVVELAPEKVDLVELRTLLSELSQRGLTEQVRAILTEAGFNKLSEVPETHYLALYLKAKELQR